VEILKLTDFRISKSELGAFFRKEDHPKYMGMRRPGVAQLSESDLIIHMRGKREESEEPGDGSRENETETD
jgi:hypothetical protein